MDPNILKNLGLNSGANPKDLELISQILNSGGNKNKLPKMSAKDRNNLINQLSSTNTINNIPEKDLKDMNEEEKKIYREELKRRIKNKQNEKKMMRTSNFTKKNNNQTVDKLAEIMKNIDPNVLSQLMEGNIPNQLNQSEQKEQKEQTEQTTSESDVTVNPNPNPSNSEKQSKLDKLNKLVGGDNKISTEQDNQENFEDYLK